ncbi:alpha/beta hydrolase [Caulobacter sp. D4A]|uniref:alpha/beta fold hydrolase n=1 Tax=unclassified Caulobacter TaxID=2648921 RepID=UPI000D72E37A|nr:MULTISPECIES: alpha/beta hydrolase [unclassified Caulobacter]PXA89213.1 alpha/beta hydrolase [Caulobacter sp. D4A]PXA92945.1 alpha/beta hydrolase [Caulobacter sp. D5]
MRLLFTPAWAIAAACLLLAAPAIAQPAETFVEVENGRLAYETCGRGETTLVLLHDGILHKAAFDAAWPALCERYRVVRYDRRGFGASTPAAAPYQTVRDLEAVIAALKIERPVLVGSSAGSGLAVDYALAHPDGVSRLVLVGPFVAGFKPSAGFIARGLKLMTLFKLGDIEGAARDPYILTKDADAQRHWVVDQLKAHPGNVGANQKERFAVDAKPRLAEIKVPTLILVGEIDIEDVQDQAKALETALPGAKRVVVPASGHFLYLERPEAFVRAIEDFVVSNASVAGQSAKMEIN